MRDQPTTEQIARLPKWAQYHIRDMAQQREAAVRALDKFEATQTPSQMYVEDFVSDGQTRGPSTRRCYVQGRRITIIHNGIELDVLMRDEALDLSWSRANRMPGDVPMIPHSHNQVWLVAPKDLYGWKEVVQE